MFPVSSSHTIWYAGNYGARSVALYPPALPEWGRGVQFATSMQESGTNLSGRRKSKVNLRRSRDGSCIFVPMSSTSGQIYRIHLYFVLNLLRLDYDEVGTICSEFQSPEKAELCELKEKKLTRDLQHGARSTVKRGSDRAAQVVQLGVNPHTADRIVGRRIDLALGVVLDFFRHRFQLSYDSSFACGVLPGVEVVKSLGYLIR
ncbi:hypothetical protein YC2023_040366 [Brassica napus]